MDPTGPAISSDQRALYEGLVAEDSDDWLRPAYDVARGVAGDAGAEHGAAAGSGDALGQVKALRLWAERAGLLFNENTFPKRFQGGREHHLVEALCAARRLVKVTIGPEFGFYAACLPKSRYRDVCHWFTTIEATPLQYLRRLL